MKKIIICAVAAYVVSLVLFSPERTAYSIKPVAYTAGLIHAAQQETEIIGADSTGMIVELREKYGPVIYDTCTVLCTYKNYFVCTGKDETAWYPIANYSAKIIKRGF
jgi:hypothetical protein